MLASIHNKITLIGSDGTFYTYPLKSKAIKEMFVEVVSGDETVSVYYVDGDIDNFDTGYKKRLISDSEYIYAIKTESEWFFWTKLTEYFKQNDARLRANYMTFFMLALQYK